MRAILYGARDALACTAEVSYRTFIAIVTWMAVWFRVSEAGAVLTVTRITNALAAQAAVRLVDSFTYHLGARGICTGALFLDAGVLRTATIGVCSASAA